MELTKKEIKKIQNARYRKANKVALKEKRGKSLKEKGSKSLKEKLGCCRKKVWDRLININVYRPTLHKASPTV